MKSIAVCSVLFAGFGLPMAMDADTASTTFTSVAERFGVWAAMTIFLTAIVVATTWLRERRMAKRIDELENELIKAVATNKDVEKALTAQTEVLKLLVANNGGQLDVLKEIKIVFSQKVCPFNTNKV